MRMLTRVFKTIYEIRILLTRKQWAVLLVFTVAQLASSFLDLLAIALIGVISSLAASNVSIGSLGDRAESFIKFLNLDSLELRGQILWLGGLVLLSLVAKSLTSMVLFRLNLRFLAQISSQLSEKLITSFFRMEISFINRKSAQDHIFSLTSGVNVLIVGIIGPTVSAIGDAFLICLIFVALFIADPGLTLLVAVSFFLTASLTLLGIQGRARYYGRRLSDIQVKSSELISNGLLLFKIYVVRNAQSKMANEISQLRGEYADVGARAKFLYSISKFVFEITTVLLIFLISVYAFVNYGVVRAATLVVLFIAASGRILPAIMRLQQTIVSLRSALSESNRTLKLIKELREMDVDAGEFQLRKSVGRIAEFVPDLEFRSVSFAFKEKRMVLSNLNLKVGNGETVAVVGKTGVGKTTLVDLLLGLRKPINGTVKISGLDPQEAFSLFPGKISYVPQDSHVFLGTLRENLTVGLDEELYSDSQILSAVQIACLMDVVENLEWGLDAKVGDRGNTLSGGQRQRIGIARAILSSPQLLIFDEATNSLDLGTEKQILKNVFKYDKSRTGIIISHRLETLSFVDRIIFLESPGVVIESNIETLIRSNREFQKLIDAKVIKQGT